MSHEIYLGSRKLIAKTISGKVYLWTEECTDDEKREANLANSQRDAPSAVARASFLAAGVTDDAVGLSYDQFFELIEYVFTNEDLRDNDPRSGLLDKLKSARVIDGWNIRYNSQSKRLDL